MMTHKKPLSALGVSSVRDLSVLDSNPPPLSFEKDLHLPESNFAVTYKSPNHDKTSYFAPGGP